MTAVETYEHAGVSVQILPDDSGCGNPRDADNLSEMFVCYRGYELGDTQLPEDGFPEIDCPRCEGAGEVVPDEQQPDDQPDTTDCPRCEGLGYARPTLREWLSEQKAIAAVPLFVLDHSGLSIRGGRFTWLADEAVERDDTRSDGRFAGDGQGWDTSFVGFALVTRERVLELCGNDNNVKYQGREFLEEAIGIEIAEYDKFLRGEVYGYIAGEGTPFEDSCWGFLGFDYVKEAANEAADCIAEELAKESAEVAEWAARDVETVQ